MAEIFLQSDSQGAPSAETRHDDSARQALDTREEHGLLHKKDNKNKTKQNKSYFLQTHILKQTLLLQARKAGGWQAEWKNGRTERGASILITFKKKSHTLRHTLHILKVFFERYSYSFLILLHGARMKPGKEHFNTMFYFESCFILTFCKIR